MSERDKTTGNILLQDLFTPTGVAKKTQRGQAGFARIMAQLEVVREKETQKVIMTARRANLQERMKNIEQSGVIYQTFYLIHKTCNNCGAQHTTESQLMSTYRKQISRVKYSHAATTRIKSVGLFLDTTEETISYCLKCINN